MFVRIRAILVGAAVLCFTSPWSTSAQPGPGPAAQPGEPTQAADGGFLSPKITRDQAQDTQFIALLSVRDDKFAYMGELRRIIAFHDNFRSRMESLLTDNSFPHSDAAKLRQQVSDALAQLQTFEKSVKEKPDINEQRHLAETFDKNYPLFRGQGGKPVTTMPQTWRSVLQRERVNASEVILQNPSQENRAWLTRYQAVFSLLEKELPTLDPNTNFSVLNSLPLSFAVLAGAQPDANTPANSRILFASLTPDQIQGAIEKYRTALQRSFSDIKDPPPQISDVRTRTMLEIDKIGNDLLARSNDANAKVRELEKTITGQAKALYGNKVGSDSFNYLLIVFAAVFALIMAVPRFYPEAVAVNILKAEFLLQFSTVFVLVAAIIILGIGELIDKQQLPVLLAGISGYVLGQLGKPS